MCLLDDKICDTCPHSGSGCMGKIEECDVGEEELKMQILSSLQMLYKENQHLITSGVYEACLSAHFWFYFKTMYQNKYGTNLNIDAEYDRDGFDEKMAMEQGARPDMIIHRRNCNRYNFACFEFKKRGQTVGKDVRKIKEFIGDEGRYRYRHGISISLGESDVRIKWYQPGKECICIRYNVYTWKIC